MSLPVNFRDEEYTALFIWLSVHIPIAAFLSRSWAVLFILPVVETGLLAAAFHFTGKPEERGENISDSDDTTETVGPIARIPPTSSEAPSDSDELRKTQTVGPLANIPPGTKPEPAGTVAREDDTPEASEASGGLADSDQTIQKAPDSYAFDGVASADAQHPERSDVEDTTPSDATREQFPEPDEIEVDVHESGFSETDGDDAGLGDPDDTPKATPSELKRLANETACDGEDE